jgi:hypothetical protein
MEQYVTSWACCACGMLENRFPNEQNNGAHVLGPFPKELITTQQNSSSPYKAQFLVQ